VKMWIVLKSGRDRTAGFYDRDDELSCSV